MMSPCKDCDERVPNCHSKCDKYKEFRDTLDRRNEQIRKVRKSKVIFLGG